MGGCCSTYEPPDVLLVSKADGSTVMRKKDMFFPFVSEQDGVGAGQFKKNAFGHGDYVSGPHFTFVTTASTPQGTKPFDKPTPLMKALRKNPLYHGGEQILYVAWADVNVEANKGLFLLVLTSFGRLFVVKGTAVALSCHAAHMSTAVISGDALTISFADGRAAWTITTLTPALGQLQLLLWVCSSVAHTQLLLKTNMKSPPLDLLPPLAVDGNLHSAYVMQGHRSRQTRPSQAPRAHRPRPG